MYIHLFISLIFRYQCLMITRQDEPSGNFILSFSKVKGKKQKPNELKRSLLLFVSLLSLYFYWIFTIMKALYPLCSDTFRSFCWIFHSILFLAKLVLDLPEMEWQRKFNAREHAPCSGSRVSHRVIDLILLIAMYQHDLVNPAPGVQGHSHSNTGPKMTVLAGSTLVDGGPRPCERTADLEVPAASVMEAHKPPQMRPQSAQPPTVARKRCWGDSAISSTFLLMMA